MNDAEPKPPSGEVKAPRLSPAGRQVWDELAPVAVAMGTLTAADISAFAKLCELQATFDSAIVEKSRPEFSVFLITTMVDSAGNEHMNVKEHPAVKLERDTAAAMLRYYDMFGLNPVGRARISVPKADKPLDKWAAMGLA